MSKKARTAPPAGGHGSRVSDQQSSSISPEHIQPTSGKQEEIPASAGSARDEPRRRCRNLRCRSKLPAPIENVRKAFCCRGCHESFYRNRCRVCERDLRKTGKRGDATRMYCRPPANCRREAEKWPEKYGGGQWVGFTEMKLGSAHSTRPVAAPASDRGRWRWGGDGDRDHSLYDRDGLTIARVVLEIEVGRLRARALVTP
jgi:hypothetical protein